MMLTCYWFLSYDGWHWYDGYTVGPTNGLALADIAEWWIDARDEITYDVMRYYSDCTRQSPPERGGE